MTQITGVQGARALEYVQTMTRSHGGPPPAGNGGPPPISREQMDEEFRTAAAAQGVDVDQLEGLQESIRTSVQQTLQDGGSPTDVQAAIDAILEDNGIDPEQLQQQMQAAAASLGAPMGPPPGSQAGAERGAGIDPATAIGSSALLGIDLHKLLAGETTGLSFDRQA